MKTSILVVLTVPWFKTHIIFFVKFSLSRICKDMSLLHNVKSLSNNLSVSYNVMTLSNNLSVSFKKMSEYLTVVSVPICQCTPCSFWPPPMLQQPIYMDSRSWLYICCSKTANLQQTAWSVCRSWGCPFAIRL